ncbi:hypothetical protein [Bradyrhizobium sp. SZCCHNRI1029]|uniref:hypothetical protein n=1 Tax=Bradyrhizobium sp. SZCCHNRI1029 TaxID=3057278 RepID=UPI0029160680|nr:hypothetical protein [Bradyrhizobium sp. SZCCHNRI1029]
MPRHYVDISGISDEELEMLGYYLVEAEEEFALYDKKGEHFIVHKRGQRRFIYVDDINDAIILRGKATRPAPPRN